MTPKHCLVCPPLAPKHRPAAVPHSDPKASPRHAPHRPQSIATPTPKHCPAVPHTWSQCPQAMVGLQQAACWGRAEMGEAEHCERWKSRSDCASFQPRLKTRHAAAGLRVRPSAATSRTSRSRAPAPRSFCPQVSRLAWRWRLSPTWTCWRAAGECSRAGAPGGCGARC